MVIGVFLFCDSLPFRSAVVVSLRPLLVCHGSGWLVPAFFPSLSLFLPVPSSPGFLCCFARGLGCATWLCLWLCAHLLLGLGFPLLPGYPSPSIRLWVFCFQRLLFSTRVPYLRDGVTHAGSRFVCPRSKRRFSVPVWVRYTGHFLVGPHASYLRRRLRALSLRVCCQVVLAVSVSFGCP